MNDQELLVLVAKDYLLKKHQFGLLCWTRQAWHEAIADVLEKMPDDALHLARIAYEPQS